MTSTRKKAKQQNITELIIALVIIGLLNYVGSYFFFRVDLTAEKRFTLTTPSKELLTKLDDVVYVKVYVEGELPAGFKRLRNSVKEMLDEFRIYTKDNLQYEFINPSESQDKKTRNEIYSELYKKGLDPVNLKEKDEEGKTSEKIIFPGAIVSFKNKEIAINLLKNNISLSAEQNLNNSIQELEYGFISTIKKLSTPMPARIAFIEGHGEWDEDHVADITNSLYEFYNVKRIKLNQKIHALADIDAIIIAGPDTMFDEKDKFIIDQFIMKGGKVLWLIDAVKADMDSLAYTSSTLALINQTNLEDMLFKYGVRINPNLVQDLQCAVIPINTAIVGAPPQFSPAGWYYFPLISPPNTHPITKNLNMLKTEFVSTLDTVGESPDVKKHILLYSSKYSRIVNAPIRISLDILRREPDQKLFNKSYLPIAVLLEGKFQSVFQNRIPPEIEENKEIGYMSESKPTKMIVIGDGEIIRNQIKKEQKGASAFPLGYDRYTGQTFGNKDFLLNTLNYLLDDGGLLEIRSREITLRLLDRAKILDEKTKWQTINIVLPLLFILIFGIVANILKKRKYLKK